jgi:hypothetical protein
MRSAAGASLAPTFTRARKRVVTPCGAGTPALQGDIHRRLGKTDTFETAFGETHAFNDACRKCMANVDQMVQCTLIAFV